MFKGIFFVNLISIPVISKSFAILFATIPTILLLISIGILFLYFPKTLNSILFLLFLLISILSLGLSKDKPKTSYPGPKFADEALASTIIFSWFFLS